MGLWGFQACCAAGLFRCLLEALGQQAVATWAAVAWFSLNLASMPGS